MFKNFMLATFVSTIALSSAQASKDNSNNEARAPFNLTQAISTPLAKHVTITSPEDQYSKFCALTKTRSPDAAFPELLPQFKENVLALESVLQGGHLKIFQNISKQVQNFFGPEGDDLTLPSYNVAHLYFATILGDYQRFQKDNEISYMLKTEGKSIISNCVLALESVLDKKFRASSLYSRFDLERTKPAMYIEHGLYPYTMITPDGNLSMKDLMRSLADKIRLCAMPLNVSQFDGELEQTADSFLAHDWGHASPDFNGIPKINEDGLNRYRTLLSLVKNNPNENTRNLDYFCLFFIEHEGYLFEKGEVVSFEEATDEILNTLITKDLHVLQASSLAVDGVTTMDAFKSGMPNKEQPFILKDRLESYPKVLTQKIFNSDFRPGYNLLFDIKNLLEESHIDFKIWDGETFNVEGMKTILTDVFQGFKQRYTGKI